MGVLREFAQRVKDATDLVALVGEAVPLRKSGASWVGKCPFHGDRGPSFNVVPDKGFFHCFGCGKNGDALTWVQEREGLTFPEAVESLAARAGIAMPEDNTRAKEQDDAERRIRRAVETAQDFYVSQLRRAPAATAYLERRGFTPAQVEAFGLGFAPEGWDTTLRELDRNGIGQEAALAAGIASRTERGSVIDFLRGRITIPIRDHRGRVVAFGGRAMGDENPKYLNTRETALFQKGSVLFGMDRAKGAMGGQGALIVEGYFDVLSLQARGITQAVAPLGTAVTSDHIALLRRFTNRVVLGLDGDAAGQRATSKALDLAIPSGFDVRLLLFQGGQDADDWARATPPAEMAKAIAGAPDWAAFALAQAMEGRDMNRVQDRIDAARAFANACEALPEGRRQEVFSIAAHDLRIPTDILQPKAQKPGEPAKPRPEPQAPRPQALVLDPAIAGLLAAAAMDPQGFKDVQAIPHAWWEHRKGAVVLLTFLDLEGAVEDMPEDQQALVREAMVRGSQTMRPSVPRMKAVLEREYVRSEMRGLGRAIATANEQTMGAILETRLRESRMRLNRSLTA